MTDPIVTVVTRTDSFKKKLDFLLDEEGPGYWTWLFPVPPTGVLLTPFANIDDLSTYVTEASS